MKVGLYVKAENPLCDSVQRGIRALGHRVVRQRPGCWNPRDAYDDMGAVIVVGLREMLAGAAQHYTKLGVPVVLIDLPHLRVPGYLRVTPPDHAWLPTFAGAPPRDRRERILGAFEVGVRRRVKGQYVALLGQKSGDSAHGMNRGELERWARGAVEKVTALCDSEVVWRPHPKDVWALGGTPRMSDPRTEKLADCLAGAWLAVTYNSTSGLEALLAGLPVLAEGPAVYSSMSGSFRKFKDVAAPDPADVEELLCRIAYTQWTLDEIATGGPLEPLLRMQDQVAPIEPATEAPQRRLHAVR
jgi:hypothetical protein